MGVNQSVRAFNVCGRVHPHPCKRTRAGAHAPAGLSHDLPRCRDIEISPPDNKL